MASCYCPWNKICNPNLKLFGLIFQILLGFVRFDEKECVYDTTDELESFDGLNDSTISHHIARDKCEEYCSRASACWGCTFHCDSDCKWIAISHCKEFKVKEFAKRGITQKPGILVLKLFPFLDYLYRRL